jgi:hypothetical protein
MEGILSGGVDINLDGFDDIIIGVTAANENAGAAYVVFGSASPVDSSVFSLGNGGISLTPPLDGYNAFGVTVALTENVEGANTRGILVANAVAMGTSEVYYLHNFLGTAAPSVSPSVEPTVSPTVSPSNPPTAEPTARPSASPSASPTAEPTFSPTAYPTRAPTASPTASPSFTPSFVPTANPTASPTEPPTRVPSFVPSVVPTFLPSTDPTMNPTFVPSVTPTVNPSAIPTVNPSAVPSVAPSKFPSVLPTIVPTFVPSATPTFSPTKSPSVFPTESPTVTPTQAPTLVPSVDPTMTPTTVPTIVPSFRPSAPTYSPSASPTPVPTGRSKSSIIINAGFTVNSVNGATLSPTSQETIKQSIANASQTTPNNVDLVSVTRTNRRLLSSVVQRTLATASLFSYKVVAEIHFNLIDFPGLNESYVAGTKSKGLMEVVKTHELDRIISFYATINNATQLMNNATVSDVILTTSVVPAPNNSDDDSGLSDGQVAGLVVGISVGTILLSGLVYFLLLKVRSKQYAEDSVARYGSVPAVAGDAEISVDVSQIYQERNDRNLNRTQTLDMIKSSSEINI